MTVTGVGAEAEAGGEERGVDISPEQDGGVLKRILREGEGEDTPNPGCQVRVHYTGTLLDGTKFDSSRDRNEPFEFSLGKKSVIGAWDVGVATMRRGELCLLTCAPAYAYGSAGSPPKIPPDATLQFEIEMLDWKVEDLSPGKNKGILRHILTQGKGYDSPNDGAIVTVELQGRLPGENKLFEERTVTFALGEGGDVGVCEGVERALEKFVVGERSRLVIQPRYAFKSEGSAALGVPPDAVVEYTVELSALEKAKESWAMDECEKVQQAALYKEKGNAYFKADKHQLAIKMYKRTVALMDGTSLVSDKNEVEKPKAEELLVSSHLNLALVYLKVTPAHHLEAREHAGKALLLQPDNVKALFRRGSALLGLGEAEPAARDFRRVLDAEPNNKAAANQLAACRAALQQQKQHEKQLYTNMFEKFASKDREAERLAAQGLPDVMGEKLGEWGATGAESEWTDAHRNRAATHFERENPNILMLDKDGQFENM